jgi:hypothetical protein
MLHNSIRPVEPRGIWLSPVFLWQFVVVLLLAGATVSFSQGAPVDVSAIGPQIGQRVPEFSGVDQFGRSHTLASLAGPDGVMLVFFRSADW